MKMHIQLILEIHIHVYHFYLVILDSKPWLVFKLVHYTWTERTVYFKICLKFAHFGKVLCINFKWGSKYKNIVVVVVVKLMS